MKSQRKIWSVLLVAGCAWGVPVPASYGKLPLSFEANQGQADRQVKFLSRGSGYTLFLTDDSAVLSLDRASLRMKLLGANAHPVVTGTDVLPGKVNYFAGNNPEKWRTNVPTYGAVKYASVYRGIDLVYHGDQRLLEYDFRLARGADPREIEIRFDGARKLTVNSDGALVIAIGDREVIEHAPVAYQEIGGKRQAVASRYVLRAKNRVGFRVGDYDPGKELVIDPVLQYATFLGGSGYDNVWNPNDRTSAGTGRQGITVDLAGNCYVTGLTHSTDFPVTPGAVQTKPVLNDEAFVTKLNSAGTAAIYSTYLGGSQDNQGSDIAVDAAGNAYITGYTGSVDFPVTAGAFQTTHGASAWMWNAFVTKLDSQGDLVYSTFLGGSRGDWGNGIKVDAAGNAYVVGATYSSDFPVTAGAYQTTLSKNASNIFVTKLNPAGSGLVYSTLLGGTGLDSGLGIAIDSFGNAYVVGEVLSSDFPTTPGAFQRTFGGQLDATVSKLNATGAALIYSTYLGGSGFDGANNIAIDGEGNAYVAGTTLSSNFPTTAGAYQTTYGGGFVAKLNSGGTALVYSTYIPGDGYVYGCQSIAVDGSGNGYITGQTSSASFPTTADAVQSTLGGDYDAFVIKLNGDGSALLYSTYLGGTGYDRGGGIAVDNVGGVYVIGYTESVDFPATPGAFQTKYGGNGDAFVAKLLVGGQSGLTITNYQLVGQQAAAGTQAFLTYKADLLNPLNALGSLTATLTSLDSYMVRVVPGQDTLTFAPVPPIAG